jgi:predicted ArsR family transcriptional regulator
MSRGHTRPAAALQFVSARHCRIVHTQYWPASGNVKASRMLKQQLLDTSRGRIVALLQRGGLTVEEIASELGLTANAIRAQLTAMQRDGVVQRGGQKPGTTRPFHVFELTPEVEQLLSQAYVPFLTQLIDTFTNALGEGEVEALLRRVGTNLAHELPVRRRPSDSLRSRMSEASQLLNKQLGAVTHVEANGRLVIRGAGCPLAAITGKHRAVCLAMESLLTEVVGAEVRECCDRRERPKCCFEVDAENPPTRGSRAKR